MLKLFSKEMNLLSTICFTWFMVVFCISGLFINFLQLLVIPLYWLKRDWYHKIIPGLAYLIYSQFTWLGEWWSKVDFKLYVSNLDDIKHFGKENSLVISNHYSDVDWLTAWIFAERVGLIGRTKIISKSETKYLPIIGWCLWFSESGFLKRNWQDDKSNINKLINSMKRNSNTFSIFVMCEGTRRTDEKLLASQEYAVKNNFIPLKHHLFPRTKGFSLLAEALHSKVAAIYDLEFAFPDIESANMQNVVNGGKIEVLMHFRRIPMNLVPNSFDGLSNFIIEHYKKKDEIYDHFVKNKTFPGLRVPLPRRKLNLIFFSIWNIFVSIFALLWLKHCVHLYGQAIVSTILFLFLFGVYLLFKTMQNYTRTNKGSKFGLKEN
ncbi:1-acyl-sn-glycerol-3-phosphate acyltransferase delta isoform X1 [Hydra vulgaris]|uniref:1-acyl-sn-glycerol-3-phosphate acyltransferase delta isoform X1 n=1 Tax=Hydra vulgaris TaxID=6087 RepID=UPI0032EA7C98